MNYNKRNNILGWLCFAVATLVYMATAERTVSFWDCGEFIAAAYKLQIVHQPGAPLFLMVQNLFSNLAFAEKSDIAFWMNIGSALCSGLTILFLFWTITALAKKAFHPLYATGRSADFSIFGAGLIGALAFAFSDSFWFSAVETEVYAMSSLCTALVFWLILKWEAHADEPRSDKWLVLIAYIMGLSIGVHLLNLLSMPVIGLVIYFRKSKAVHWKGIFRTLLIGILVLGVILWGVIQYTVKLAGQADIILVNQLGMPFGSGIFLFVMLLVSALVYGLWHSIKYVLPQLNLVLLCTVFTLFGFGSFAMVFIRAAADPSLNNYAPDNVISFFEYVTRDQYATTPLITGPFYNSRITGVEKGSTIYRKDDDRYQKIGNKPAYQYDRTTLFPRIHSAKDADFYQSWLGLQDGEQPTFAHNINFFSTYQAGVMYWRYFMWNFVGRQNDENGQSGNLIDGNWISGIQSLDNLRLGGQYALPHLNQQNPSANHYYFIPLLLGMLGFFWHLKKDRRNAALVTLLFFFTGLAIVLYLNDTPLQPRERDYVYVGSFYAFAIWIGFGFIALSKFISKRFRQQSSSLLAFTISLSVPVLMLYEGWDDHDRSAQTAARNLYAHNYLESCEPNAILFTRGDNDTFPLWYAQEVEHVRPDVRVVNIGYLDSDWYVKQMRKEVNESAALPIQIDQKKVDKGVRDALRYADFGIDQPVDIGDLLEVMLSDDKQDMLALQDGTHENFLPTKKMKLRVDRNDVLASSTVPKPWEGYIADSIEWEFNMDYLTRGKLVILDILKNNQWKRPIYFVNMPSSELMGLDPYLVHEGLVAKLMPIDRSKMPEQERKTASKVNNDEALYANLVHKFEYAGMNKLNYLDPLTKNMVPMLTAEFSNLADSFLEKNDLKRAKEVALKGFEVLPTEVASLSQTGPLYLLTDSLYKLQETEKANVLATRNGTYLTEQLDYYLAIAESKPNYEAQRIRYGMQVLGALVENTEHYQQYTVNQQLKTQYMALEAKALRLMN